MQKLIILCLVAAIGAVATIEHALARPNTDICRSMPNRPGCKSLKSTQPQGGLSARHLGQRSKVKNGNHLAAEDASPPPSPWQSPFPHEGFGGFYFGLYAGEPPPPAGYGRNYYPGQCRDLVYVLRDEGYQNVRPLQCAGPRLAYSAWRNGKKLILHVTRDGRIRRILPAY